MSPISITYPPVHFGHHNHGSSSLLSLGGAAFLLWLMGQASQDITFRSYHASDYEGCDREGEIVTIPPEHHDTFRMLHHDMDPSSDFTIRDDKPSLAISPEEFCSGDNRVVGVTDEKGNYVRLGTNWFQKERLKTLKSWIKTSLGLV